MKEDTEEELEETWTKNKTNSPRNLKVRSNSSGGNFPRVFIGILLLIFFAGGIFYFIAVRSKASDESLSQSRIAALEQRIMGLERQVSTVQGKLSTTGPDPALLQRVDTLAQRVEALEKSSLIKTDSKEKLASPKTPSSQKRFHTVRKGETLYRISKKYGVSSDELRRLNNLSAGQSLRTGQKLLISR
ncbi:MAG: hypothetical protein A2162_12265 [Deltaproteobacteria bacterium RBG_13_52_11b]|nr:MAG: hypothetical protein A2162_12265 [Deltaproteobacteria bacterium RBG_13_52_11b]